MYTAGWFLFIGALLLAMGLSAPNIKKIPVTSAMIYLSVGILLGPTVLGIFHFNPLRQSALLEVLTEVAVLISLFSAGVKMPVPFTPVQWRVPVQLAFLSVTITVLLITLFAYFVLGLPLGAAVLLGAIAAPTDPVLATDVQIRHPGDRDQLRFTLTCEAGMNDGSSFPFVMLGLGLLGLHDLGEFGWRWILVDVLWATLAGIAVGVFAGRTVALIVMQRYRDMDNPRLLNDFLGLGLIGVVYGFSLLINAWGFLAVFAAAVSLRQSEFKLARTPANLPMALSSKVPGAKPAVLQLSEAALVFKEHLERLSEVVLVLLIGGTLFIDSWSLRAVGFALFVFLIARPASVAIGLIGTSSSWRTRGLTSWFGVRGIGSLYYLMYAIQHGIPEDIALELIHFSLSMVTLSIFLHGISVKPMIRQWSSEQRETKGH